MKKYLIRFTKKHNETGRVHYITRKYSGDSLMEIINKIKNTYDMNIYSIKVEDINLLSV